MTHQNVERDLTVCVYRFKSVNIVNICIYLKNRYAAQIIITGVLIQIIITGVFIQIITTGVFILDTL